MKKQLDENGLDGTTQGGAKRGGKMKRFAVIGVLIAIAVFAYQYFGLADVLTLERLKESKEELGQFYANQPVLTAVIYFAIYVLAAALSFPGAAVLTLAGGAIFGFTTGLVLVSFASSLGALLAFLAARYVLRDSVQTRFAKQLEPINEGMEKEGIFYLLTLRLVPVFPFFMVNLLAGLTSIKAFTYYWVSQLGMLAGTAVYVNAGTQLAGIESLGDVISPAILLSFVLLGIFPLIAKFIVNFLQRRKVYAGWEKPEKFDRNLIVIGAGAGGLVTSYIAATVKSKVTLVESHKMGGDCLNFGCVPSKALIKSAKLAKYSKTADKYGLKAEPAEVDFPAVMERVHDVIKTIEPHDSVERYTSLGVEVKEAYARIVSPWEVEIDSPQGLERLTTKNIVIAAGASPFIPPIPGIENVNALTSDTLWGVTEQPKSLVVMGGGPIGCELAQSFARLGSQVTLIERGSRLLPREDEEVSELVINSLREDGIEVLMDHTVVEFEKVGEVQQLIAEHKQDGHLLANKTLQFDAVLCAVGRKARTEGYGVEKLGITLDPNNTIQTNAYLQTNYPNIYAVGDVAGPYQLTHAAAHQAWYAAVNALFGRFKRFKVDYRVIPWTTFTDPEVARVGLSEAEAQSQGIAYDVTRYEIDDLDRAIADSTTKGFVKVLTVPGKDTILGALIVSEHAGDLLAEFVLAMKHKLGLNKILGTIHTYPTLAEANKYAAGEWKKANKPEKILEWLEKFHSWSRG